MGVLSLNGNFSYPIELNETLTVDKKATFLDSVCQGFECIASGERSFTNGESCSAESKYSRAEGYKTDAKGQYSHACGYVTVAEGTCSHTDGTHSHARESDSFSYVWQGVETDNIYHSNGKGTFNINPYKLKNGIQRPEYGFYINDEPLPYYISGYAQDTILKNDNVISTLHDWSFTGVNQFINKIVSDGTLEVNSQLNATSNSTASFEGSITVPDLDIVSSESSGEYSGAASIKYAKSIAQSAINNVGFTSIHDRTLTDTAAVPYEYLKSYVLSCVDDVNSFIDITEESEKYPLTIASKGHVLSMATSASNYTLISDNTFTGKNTFTNSVTYRDTTVYLESNAIADFTRGTLKIRNSNITENSDNVPASTSFSRAVATSGLEYILNQSNTYNGNNIYNGSGLRNGNFTVTAKTTLNGETDLNGRVVLGSNVEADFKNGDLQIKNPSITTNLANMPASTQFVHSVATSAIHSLLISDDVFKGTLTFDGNTIFKNSVDFTGNGAYVKTQSVDNKTLNAASTEFVQNVLTFTLSTSSQSVRNLIFNNSGTFNEDITFVKNAYVRNIPISEYPSNQIASTNYVTNMINGKILGNTTQNTYTGNNRHTGTDDFIDGIINVKTQNIGDSSNKAASTEFVTRAIGNIDTNPFSLFDIKWLDYELGASSWKKSGSAVSSSAAYAHIRNEYHAATSSDKTDKINGRTIPYKLAIDGHKIVNVSNKGVVDAVYNTTGIAWYYILDEANSRIYLPRTNYSFTGVRTSVGTYVPPGIPLGTFTCSSDGAHYHTIGVGSGDCGCSKDVSVKNSHKIADWNYGSSSSGRHSHTITQTKDSVYGNSSTVQTPATQMFLYFYCF